jgi:hypothetical protein
MHPAPEAHHQIYMHSHLHYTIIICRRLLVMNADVACMIYTNALIVMHDVTSSLCSSMVYDAQWALQTYSSDTHAHTQPMLYQCLWLPVCRYHLEARCNEPQSQCWMIYDLHLHTKEGMMILSARLMHMQCYAWMICRVYAMIIILCIYTLDNIHPFHSTICYGCNTGRRKKEPPYSSWCTPFLRYHCHGYARTHPLLSATIQKMQWCIGWYACLARIALVPTRRMRSMQGIPGFLSAAKRTIAMALPCNDF